MTSAYESAGYLAEYLVFHYGAPRLLCPWPSAPRSAFEFHARVARLAWPWLSGARVLDLGCAVGRLGFELSKRAAEVVGIDKSRAFIRAANRLCRHGSIFADVAGEGGQHNRLRFQLPRGARRERVRFLTGDAQRLPARLGDFDVVIAANLIDRLPDPRSCLRQMQRLVRPGGLLVLTSPYSWLEDYTPKRNWLGSLPGVRRALGRSFQLLRRQDLPFLIREHRRKFQLVVAEATVWRRKA